jgi:serine/threonine protein phosphatase PrpC
MSRSFGDKLAASIGVTAKPQTLIHNIQPEDKFLVLASDGIWEFMSNE